MTAISFSAPRATRLRLTHAAAVSWPVWRRFPPLSPSASPSSSGGSALASRDASAPSGSFTTLTVTAGESLWSIAEQVAPGADPRDVVDAIVRLNALEGVTVSAGQRLSIPAEYAPAP